MNESASRVSGALTDLVKASLLSDDAESQRSRQAARAALARLAEAPPASGAVRMEGVWTLAVQAAEAPELQPREGAVNLTLPRQCPFTLEDLLAPGFDVDAAVDQIRKSASTG